MSPSQFNTVYNLVCLLCAVFAALPTTFIDLLPPTMKPIIITVAGGLMWVKSHWNLFSPPPISEKTVGNSSAGGIGTAAAVLILCLLGTAPIHAQAVGGASGYETPDQTITAGLQFDQAAAPQLQGDASYAKHVSSGVYSFTDVRLTSLQFQPVPGSKIPRIEVQTQTETGICTYIASVFSFALSTCAGGGLSAAPGQTAGASGSGSLVGLQRTKWKDLVFGFNAGPSYSAVAGGVSWVFGLRIGWAK